MVVVVPQNILSSNSCSISASLCFEMSISQRQGARGHVAEKSSWQIWQTRDAIWVVSRTLPQQVQDKLTQKPVKLIYGILRSKNSLEQTIRGRWGYCLNSRLIKSKTWGRRAKHLPTGIQSGPTSNSWWSQRNAWCATGRCGCLCGSGKSVAVRFSDCTSDFYVLLQNYLDQTRGSKRFFSVSEQLRHFRCSSALGSEDIAIVAVKPCSFRNVWGCKSTWTWQRPA